MEDVFGCTECEKNVQFFSKFTKLALGSPPMKPLMDEQRRQRIRPEGVDGTMAADVASKPRRDGSLAATIIEMISQQNQQLSEKHSPWRLSVAPMMDWTD